MPRDFSQWSKDCCCRPTNKTLGSVPGTAALAPSTTFPRYLQHLVLSFFFKTGFVRNFTSAVFTKQTSRRRIGSACFSVPFILKWGAETGFCPSGNEIGSGQYGIRGETAFSRAAGVPKCPRARKASIATAPQGGVDLFAGQNLK